MICEKVNAAHAVGQAVHIEDQVQRSGLGRVVQLKLLRENRKKRKTAHEMWRFESEFQQKLKRRVGGAQPFCEPFILIDRHEWTKFPFST